MSSWHPENEISISDSEDEDEDLKAVYHGRDAMVFVVDSNLYHEPDRLDEALNLIRSAFLSGLLVNDHDLMALVIANTENSSEPFERDCLDAIVMPENCAVFLPPRQLNTAIVEHFLRFVETSPNDFADVYGVSNEGGNFAHLLRLCLDLVQNCNYSVDNTTIIYLTDKETPHPVQSESYRQALQKASDLSGKENVEFQVIPMINLFNYDVFYKEFICLVRDIEIDSFEPGNPQRQRELLADRKIKQNFVRRSLGHFKFSLGPDVSLSAQYFNYFQKDKGPRKVLIQRTDNAVVRRHRLTQVFKQNPESSELEQPRAINIKDAWYEINLGNSSIRLSYEQVNRVRNLHSPGMMLLGFKSRSELSKALFCKSYNFMYPDDGHIIGSKRLFMALWERCKAKDKVAVCLFMCKRKSMPRYVALVPVSKDDAEPDSYYSLLTNDGFKMVYLPCSSYIRKIDFSDWNSIENHAPDEGVEVCRKLVKKFRLDYKPGILCDPDLDQLQSKLLALAFNVKFETLGSQYFPNAEQQDQRIANLIPKFEEIFGEDVEPAKKRSAKAETSNAPKVPKMSADNLSDKNYVMQMISNKSLASCTKDQLMEILKTHFDKTVPKSTKKPDLLDIIYSYN
ncbi:inverted repeat-binding protein [Haematobia irritans]|uniref:inverted repeat-binding protein n=1 Tax=Haematobia irritans TaxID=7368 RepID=UPI003F507BE7